MLFVALKKIYIFSWGQLGSSTDRGRTRGGRSWEDEVRRWDEEV